MPLNATWKPYGMHRKGRVFGITTQPSAAIALIGPNLRRKRSPMDTGDKQLRERVMAGIEHIWPALSAFRQTGLVA